MLNPCKIYRECPNVCCEDELEKNESIQIIDKDIKKSSLELTKLTGKLLPRVDCELKIDKSSRLN